MAVAYGRATRVDESDPAAAGSPPHPRERWPQLASMGSTVATARSPLSPGSRSPTPRRKRCPNPGRRPATDGTQRGTTASTHPRTERGDHRQTLTDTDPATSPRRRPGYRRPGGGRPMRLACDARRCCRRDLRMSWIRTPRAPISDPPSRRCRHGSPAVRTVRADFAAEDRPLVKDLLPSGWSAWPLFLGVPVVLLVGREPWWRLVAPLAMVALPGVS